MVKTPKQLNNKNELKQAMNQMENDKSPGTDGIPIESYITLYEAIENDFLQPYNDIPFNKQNATKTMHQAIITPIPKKVI